MSSSGPSEAVMERVAAVYALIEADTGFLRLRRLMEIDWTEADTTAEAIGLPRLLQTRARKLATLAASGLPIAWSDVADAIRYTERHDETAQTALWWLAALRAAVSSE